MLLFQIQTLALRAFLCRNGKIIKWSKYQKSIFGGIRLVFNHSFPATVSYFSPEVCSNVLTQLVAREQLHIKYFLTQTHFN